MKHLQEESQVALSEAEVSDIAELKDKRQTGNLLPPLPELQPSGNCKNQTLEASEQPLEWINKESLQQLRKIETNHQNKNWFFSSLTF